MSDSPTPTDSDDGRQVSAARYTAATRLLDSLLHDVRNPLNALSINLEVLGQKLKGPDGSVPASPEKNLSAMREQITRIDGLLRLFADFIAPKPSTPAEVDFSEVTRRALETLAHEARRARVTLKVDLAPGLKVRSPDPSLLTFVALQPVLRAIARSKPGQEVSLALTRQAGQVQLSVRDAAGVEPEPFPEARAAISALCALHEGSLSAGGNTWVVSLYSK